MGKLKRFLNLLGIFTIMIIGFYLIHQAVAVLEVSNWILHISHFGLGVILYHIFKWMNFNDIKR